MRTLSLLPLGLALSLAACGPSASGVADAGNHTDGGGGSCTGSQTRCSGTLFQRCVGNAWTDDENCPQLCDNQLGCVGCDPSYGHTCVGDEVHVCNTDGSIGALTQTCMAGSCTSGVCNDPCSAAAASRSYIGCEYWAVDLDNAIEVLGPDDYLCSYYGGASMTASVCWDGSTTAGLCDYGNNCSASPGTSCSSQDICGLDAQHSPFAIVVSNPDTSGAASVSITNAAGSTQTVSVGPGAVQAIFPQNLGFADQSLDYSGIESKAYRILSDRPIVAYQFNPLDNVGVFSNDASLLIPSSTYDIEYFVLAYPTLTRRPSTNDYNGYMTIVAGLPGTTTVTVTPSCAIRAGTGVGALTPGSTQTFTLNQYQTLNLEAAAGGDVSGSYVTGSQPFGMFAGHEAAVISNQDPPPCCADHLEDQLFPASTWGMSYAIARSKQRTDEPDLLRILAQKGGTAVTFSPPVSGCPATLNAGAFCDVFITGDIQVTGDKPILVAHYLLSNINSSGDVGDPAIAFAVPTEQFRADYTFLVPSQYAENYVSLVAAAGSTVTLDGADVTSQLSSTIGSGFVGGRISVAAGQHKLLCPAKCGVEVYGYDDAVSYLFAGGLDLVQIVE